MKQNYHCSASGEIAGGEYGEISVSGGAKMTGDVQCDRLGVSGGVKTSDDLACGEMHVSGGLKVSGNLSAETAKISGSTRVEGSLEISETAAISGSLKCEGDAKLGSAKVSGGCTVEGKVEAKELKISGGLRCGGDVNAESFACSGGVKIGGLLNAETIVISASGDSEVGDIGCSSITVKQEHFTFGIHRGSLKAGTIEGDTVQLEYTKAEVVRGKNVTIGKKCEIGRVEYTGTLEILDGGKVKEQGKI